MKKKKSSKYVDIYFNISPEKNFTQVPNKVLRDPMLSANSKIVLAILLGNRIGWKSSSKTIQKMMKEGDAAIRTAIQVLEQNGYLYRIKVQNKSDGLFNGTVWVYSDSKENIDLRKAIKQIKKRKLKIYGFAGGITPIKKGSKAKTKLAACGSETCGRPKTNNINIKKINLKISRRPKGTPVDISKLTIKERNIQHKPIARHIARIVKLYKNLKPTPRQLSEWSNQIRILVEGRGASVDRITKALDWYEKHYADKYVPVIESGCSLKDKFSNLEDAMKRDTGAVSASSNGQKPRPKKVIRDGLNGVEAGVTNSMFRYYDKAVELMPEAPPAELAQNLCNVYNWLVENKEVNANTKSARYKDRVGPTESVVSHYISWLKKQEWIDNKMPRLFDGKGKVFQNFLRAESKERGTDILTGLYV